MQPRQHRCVEAGGQLRGVPRTALRAAGVAAGSNEQRVAASDLDVRELLPRFEIRYEQRCLLRQPLDALHQRHVDEDAARDVAGSQAVHAVGIATLEREVLRMAVEDERWLTRLRALHRI